MFSNIQFYISAATILAVSACTPVGFGGSGSTSTGEAIVGELVIDPVGTANQLYLRSPSGWVCSSTFKSSKSQQVNKTVPLTCTNGAKGTAILSLTRFGNQVAVAFKLNNGTSGNLEVGGA